MENVNNMKILASELTATKKKSGQKYKMNTKWIYSIYIQCKQTTVEWLILVELSSLGNTTLSKKGWKSGFERMRYTILF